MGMAMNMMLIHSVTIPVVMAAEGSLLPKTSISDPGTTPAKAKIAPEHKPTRPAQPHRITAATVAIIPCVFLSISFSLILAIGVS